MSEQATYELHVDWDRDGSFATAGDDISSDFRRGEIDRAFVTPLARFAMTGRASFLLKNVDKAYSPPLDATVLPFRPVRFRMTYNAVTKVLFRGFIERIVPAPGEFGPRTAVLDCVDATALLDIFEGRLGTLLDVYADQVINPVVNDVYTPPATDYDDGLNLFPTSGERWNLEMWRPIFGMSAAFQENVRASDKILNACSADWGRFFIAKDGAPTFRNRHAMPLDSTVDLTVTASTMRDMAYEKRASEVYNWIMVTYQPRTVGQDNEVLGEFAPERAVQIKPLSTETFTIPYRDPSNRSIHIGALNTVTPVSGTDYKATGDEAGDGDDITANLNVTFTGYADHAEIDIENTDNAADAFIQFFRVRGKPVRVRAPETVTAIDQTSIDTYGQRRLPVNAMMMSNNAQAQSLADYLLDVYKDPQDIVSGVEIVGNRSATLMAAVRDLELLDKVTLSEGQTGLSSFSGHIYQMRHVINSKFEHALAFALMTPYEPGTPFFLGDTLDSGNVMIY